MFLEHFTGYLMKHKINVDTGSFYLCESFNSLIAFRKVYFAFVNINILLIVECSNLFSHCKEDLWDLKYHTGLLGSGDHCLLVGWGSREILKDKIQPKIPYQQRMCIHSSFSLLPRHITMSIFFLL